MAKPFRTQLRLQQLTGSFGDASQPGRINDDPGNKATKSAIYVQDLSGSLSYLASAIRRIHGNPDFSNADAGIFHQSLSPATHYGNTKLDLGQAGKAWGDVHAQNFFGTGSFHSVAVSDLTQHQVVIAGASGELIGSANITYNGSTAVLGDDVDLGSANTDTISFVGRVDTTIEPSSDAGVNLGSATLEFGELHANAVKSATTLDVDAGGEITVDAGANAISIGANAADAGAINVGTSTGARTITVGNAASLANTTEVELNAALVDVNAGANGIQMDAAGASQLKTTASTLTLEGKTGVSIKEDGTTVIDIDNNRDVVVGIAAGSVTIPGELIVQGATTTVSSSNLVIQDSIIGLGFSGSNDNQGPIFNDVGDRAIIFGRSSGQGDALAALNYVRTGAGTGKFELARYAASPTSGAMGNAVQFEDLKIGALELRGGLALPDSVGDHTLTLQANDFDLTGNRTLDFRVDSAAGDANRVLTIEADAKLDQDYTVDAGVRFASLQVDSNAADKIEIDSSNLQIGSAQDLVLKVGNSATTAGQPLQIINKLESASGPSNKIELRSTGGLHGFIQSSGSFGGPMGPKHLLLSSSADGANLASRTGIALVAGSGQIIFGENANVGGALSLDVAANTLQPTFARVQTGDEFLRFDFNSTIMRGMQDLRMNSDKAVQFRSATEQIDSPVAGKLQISAAAEVAVTGSYLAIGKSGTSAGDVGRIRLLDKDNDNHVELLAADAVTNYELVLPAAKAANNGDIMAATVSGDKVTLAFEPNVSSQRLSTNRSVIQQIAAGHANLRFNDTAKFAAAAGGFERDDLNLGSFALADIKQAVDVYLNGQLLISGSGNGTSVDANADYHLVDVGAQTEILFGFDVEVGDVLSVKIR